MGYRPFDEELAYVAVFGFDGDFKIELITKIEGSAVTKFFVVDLADLDGNGDDELIMGYMESLDSEDYMLRVWCRGSS